MPNEISTVQSLRAVDAWIDVINANINGGVRTAFKSSRLKFGGTNTNVARAGTTTSLPLQFPEPGLITANTVIDFSQGAITASTENSHLAIQGDGYFFLVTPFFVQPNGFCSSAGFPTGNIGELVTRDGEFHTNQNGLMVNANGWFLTTLGNAFTIYNNIDNPANAPALTKAIRLTDFLANNITAATICADGVTPLGSTASSLAIIANGKQSLQYSQFGSTIFDFGHRQAVQGSFSTVSLSVGTPSNGTILSKSLEASNASMTQSVPELSLAQKLFSALTKILQTSQTNTDSVLNLVR